MLLEITHETQLGYSSPISESVIELRMAPRQEQDQRRLAFSLAVGPSSSVSHYFDWLGNMVHAFNINPHHETIRVVATSVVETLRRQVDVSTLTDWWPVGVEESAYDLYDFVQFGGPVADGRALRDLVAEVNPTYGERLGDVALRLMALIVSRFEYQKGITTAASPITEMLEKRRGVCQDFAHLMIAGARAMRIPARYVSGCLHPETDHSRGYTETHAWCEIYFPSVGWIGFDPANNCVANENFVKLGVGRSYADVPPNKGVFRGKANEVITVKVRSRVLHQVPEGLEPERVTALPLRTRPVTLTATADQMSQQHEQQQQEQQQQ